ncbi:SCO family protein [Tundrisphaera lichenicola]|uniref:SCO family protein n=1 Tax=Tundrisphaera lichenicola TaxID=2029860 RepID=UPI003EBA6663
MYALLICTALTVASDQDSFLADIGPAPDVELVDTQRHFFSLGSLRGKAVVVSFVYTTCTGTCPLTTAKLDKVRRRLREEGLWGRSVEFVSITLDPDRDTPEVLERYARAYRADPNSWHFLTGPPDRVAKVISDWDMWAKLGPSGVIDHPSRIFLLDPSGHRREIYNLESLTPEIVAQDIRAVIAGGNATR